MSALREVILKAARRHTRERAHPSDEVLALLGVLTDRLAGAKENRLHPGDLVDDLKSKLHRDHMTSAWVGHLLRRNGFEKPEPPEDRDADGVFYRITRERVEAIQARYSDPSEQPTNLHTLQTYTGQPAELYGHPVTNVGM